MLTSHEYRRIQTRIQARFEAAGIAVTAAEGQRIEVADFGLNNFPVIGLGILVYVNTDRYCAKELALGPGQTCPEHAHPPVGADPGKEETFRCRAGKAFVYLEGPATAAPQCRPPAGYEGMYTVWQEHVLGPGDQVTIAPGTKHWFQAGPEGAVVSEFSSRSTDENDRFTDPAIQRRTVVG